MGPVAGLISEAALAKTVLSTTGKAVGSEDDSIDEVGELQLPQRMSPTPVHLFH